MTTSSTWRVVLALLGWVVCPDSPDAGPTTPLAVEVVKPRKEFVRGYALSVVEMPTPPAWMSSPGDSGQAGCPFELRAIVVAEPQDDSFAVLSWRGESRVVRRGEKVRLGKAEARVLAVDSSAVLLDVGEDSVRCVLR